MEFTEEALKDSKWMPVWMDSPDKPEVLPALDKDEECELLIVGGGFTGLWAALKAKELNPDIDIILIEGKFIGYGASGRNGGFVQAALTHGALNAEYHFPGEDQRLYDLGIENLKGLVATFDKYNIDAEYECVGETDVAISHGQLKILKGDYEEKKAEGYDVTWYDQDEIREEVDSPLFLSGFRINDGLGGVLNPARLCWGLRRTILSLGVRIYEGTPLLGYSEGETGMQAKCKNGNIQCAKMLMATNAYPNPMQEINKSVLPVWDYQLCTEPLNDAQLKSIKWGDSRHALGDFKNMFHYFRMTKDNRITWGGGGSVCYYYGNRTDDSVADDRERFEQLSREFFMIFPQLKGVKFTHRWSGIIASTTRFCMVPGVAHDGRVAWAVGYTGLGVGATRFGARIGLELLGYNPTDVIDLMFVKKKAMNWPPEPIRWMGVTLTRHALARADRNGGKRGLWLKTLDYFNLGFAC